MRYLIMCEGPNEEALINILLDAKMLKIDRDELIGLRPYNIRQLNNPNIISELKRYNNPVVVYRVGDTQNDKISIPKELKKIVSQDNIYKYCTKPELEILLILNENLKHEYEKVKSTVKPKIFAKKNIKYNGKKYDNSTDFYMDYYGGKNISKLISNLKEYKSYKRHDRNELYLIDLLK